MDLYSSTEKFITVRQVGEGKGIVEWGIGNWLSLAVSALLLCVFGRSFLVGVLVIEVGD